MGTEKRERKKANRAARQQREVRRDRLIGLRRRAVRWGVIVVGAVAAVVAIAAIGGAFSDDSEQANQRVDDPTTEVVEDVSTVTAGEESTAEACPPTDGSAAQRREFDAYPPMCIDEAGSYSAVIETNFGSMTVELDADAAPLTVNNFVTLARYGYFNDTVCHRIIPDFVVQCGDPTATGTGGPGYRFPDELPAAGDYQPVLHHLGGSRRGPAAELQPLRSGHRRSRRHRSGPRRGRQPGVERRTSARGGPHLVGDHHRGLSRRQRPEWPKPPPRSSPPGWSTSVHATRSTRWMTSCAMRSPRENSKTSVGSVLTSTTLISPR